MAQAKQSIRIGGAAGFWGESDMALPQLLNEGGLDFIVFDYLAEITLSIMARQRAKDPTRGYATDFVTSVLAPHLNRIADQGVRIISNAGGMNPAACGEAVRGLVEKAGLDLKIAVVQGDDLMDRADQFSGETEMFSGVPFPPVDAVASVNAYLGAFPIARALDEGADIVITGRCVDSAVTLGACIHAFGWSRDDLDQLAGGSLAGHLLECGPQATGGNFTDWRSVADDLDTIGYPIAEITPDGAMTITKPRDTGGEVTPLTVGEQMLYEIGDPAAYALPDVVCDFTGVRLEQTGPDEVHVSGAKGHPAPDTYKVSVTWADGFRAGTVAFFYGEEASDKARVFADHAIKRARRKLQAMNAPDFTETLVEVSGDESIYGEQARVEGSRDVALKIAARHPDIQGAGLLMKEITGLALATPAGLTFFAGGQSRPSPVVRLFSFLTPKADVPITIDCDGNKIDLAPETGTPLAKQEPKAAPATYGGAETSVPLIKLAVARSGDKGDKANIGVLPRSPDYAPWIWAALTETEIVNRFAHLLKGGVDRYFLPGTGSMNIVLHDVLGGGGIASLRNDPQGKGYAQLLLQTPIPVPASIARDLT